LIEYFSFKQSNDFFEPMSTALVY